MRTRINWMRSSGDGKPTLIAVLVAWLSTHYASYSKRGKRNAHTKDSLLGELQSDLIAAGGEEIAISSLKTKIDNIKRELQGALPISAAVQLYTTDLSRIMGITPSMLSDYDDSDTEDEQSRNQPDDEEPSHSFISPMKEQLSKLETDDTQLAEVAQVAEVPPTPLPIEDSRKRSAQDTPVQQKRIKRSGPSSVDEINVIGALLAERHRLEQLGVAQQHIDAYLPLP